MVPEKKKKEWITPKIEQINLEFDKEMDAPCFGSSNTPTGDSNCGTGAGPSTCWNSNRK